MFQFFSVFISKVKTLSDDKYHWNYKLQTGYNKAPSIS